MTSGREEVDAVFEMVEGVRAKLLRERTELVAKIKEIDAQVARLPGSGGQPVQSIEEWRSSRKMLRAAEIGRAGQAVNARDIVHAVARYYGKPVPRLLGSHRGMGETLVRHVAMFLARRFTGDSLPEIAMLFGNRDHTTVHAACRKIEARMKEDGELREEVSTLERVIGEAVASRVDPSFKAAGPGTRP